MELNKDNGQSSRQSYKDIANEQLRQSHKDIDVVTHGQSSFSQECREELCRFSSSGKHFA